MALTYMVPCKLHTPEERVVLSGEWMSRVLPDVETPLPLNFQYRHTNRQALAIVDMTDSTRDEAINSPTFPRLTGLRHQGQTEDGQEVITFAPREYYWNSELRKRALEEGLHKYVPQVLYLVRPETAYVSCLHFLARELGGINDIKGQREFIFRNSGLASLMVTFWERVQETYWSGGFSPAIAEEDRLLLILALFECFIISQPDRGRVPPRPQLALNVLNEVGIHLPSVEYPDWEPTPQAFEKLRESQKRGNYPGLPGPLGSYVECFTCGTKDLQPSEKHQCVPQKNLECPPCGLKFESLDQFHIHVLTFCKQGPHNGSTCPCCNTKGPECLCATHWKRTYDLGRDILEGKVEQASYLTLNPELPSTLIEAKVYLGMDLLPSSKPAETDPQVPHKLSNTDWDYTNMRFPERVHLPDGDGEQGPHFLLPHLAPNNCNLHQ